MFLNQYNQLRAVGMRLSEEIPQLYDLEGSLPKIIRILGIGQGRKLVLKDEEEINFIMDFYLHEVLLNGRTPLERYRTDHPNLEPIEIAYLDATKASYTSLFKVIKVSSAENMVIVIDLLSLSEQPLSVFNVNLSRTANPGHIIFSRLLPYAEFNAFAGMFAVFDENSDRALLKRYRVMKNRVKSDCESIQRFAACFKLNRSLGLEIRTTTPITSNPSNLLG